ncbi:MAG: NTP transferase domain-containing protein [Planctomycetota bacterium]
MSNPLTNSAPAGGGRPLAAVILAAGKGTRMEGEPPKVVYEVAGRAMVRWVVEAARAAGARPIVLIVGHGAEMVRGVFRDDDDDIVYVTQDPQLGTGHATACAKPVLETLEGDVLVLAGDGPLIRPATIRALVERHRHCGAAATLATARVSDPTGYGRILRDEHGRFKAILEHANATDEELAICEIYPSYACFDAALLFEMLGRLAPNALSGEYLITEVPGMLRAQGYRVELVDGIAPEDVLSVNTPSQLAEVDAILSARVEDQS